MDQMLTPPADRPKTRPYRLVMLMGLTALLYLLIARQFGNLTEMVAAAGSN
jgi:hypothetical protein